MTVRLCEPVHPRDDTVERAVATRMGCVGVACSRGEASCSRAYRAFNFLDDADQGYSRVTRRPGPVYARITLERARAKYRFAIEARADDPHRR
jgi:hypothetical protein